MHWVLNFKVHKNMHRDKKMHFKMHQTCTGTKKTKALNFKVHQTCTGTNWTTPWPERTMAQCIQQTFFYQRSTKVILLHPVHAWALKQQTSNKQTCTGSVGNRSSSVVNSCKHMIPRQWDWAWSAGFCRRVSVKPKSLYLTQCDTQACSVFWSKRAWSHNNIACALSET